MFAGHVGAALVLKRAERRVNLGVLILAALLLDVLLWLFVLAGLERVIVPADYASRHYVTFVFPYSHSLAASLVWSILAGALTWMATAGWVGDRGWATVVVATAVFSHFLLDFLVHIPELPLLGETSPKVGLGLWNQMPVALMLEVLITVGGLLVFLRGVPLGRGRTIGLVGLVVFVTTLTVAGMTVAPVPPSIPQLAISSDVGILLVAAVGGWLDRSV
jgi:hypothetical protein